MTLHSARCSPKHTENTPITSVWKVCLSVSRQCLSRPIERGNPWERATSIRLVLVSETRTVFTISFLQSPKLKEWSIERGNLWESSSSAQIRTLFDEQRQNDHRRMLRKNFSSRTPSSSSRNKIVKFYKKHYGISKRIFVKFNNKILLRWRNYENSRVLPSIRTRSSSRTRTLLWNYLEDYKNCKMK